MDADPFTVMVVPEGTPVDGRHRSGQGVKLARSTHMVKIVATADERATWVGHDGYRFSAPLFYLWVVDPNPPEGFNTCRECRHLLPLSAFNPSALKYGSRVLSTCRECKRSVYAKKHSKSNKTGHRLRKYGITDEDFNRMRYEQDYKCAVCELPEFMNRTQRALNVDHCHSTGKVRSLLCTSCNMTLGYMKDSPDMLRRLALYLEQHGGV